MDNETTNVTDRSGTTGVVRPEGGTKAAGRNPDVIVELAGGATVRVPKNRLVMDEGAGYQFDGVFGVPATPARDSVEEVEAHHVPLAREELHVGRRVRDTGRVRITKHVHERTEVIDEPVLEEHVEVRRVPVGRVVEEPPAIREEGDVTVIPVLEERLVLRKELVLKEELHVRRTRTEKTEQREVTLRSEEAVVEREPVPRGTGRGEVPSGARDARAERERP